MTSSGTPVTKASESLSAARGTISAAASGAIDSIQRQLPQGYANVSDSERKLSMIGGGALALYSLGRGSPLAMLLGGYLAYRGISGHCAVYDALGIDTHRPERPRKPLPRKQDVVMEASEDSFPASDPPSWGESGVKG